jgi:hypothetical protein
MFPDEFLSFVFGHKAQISINSLTLPSVEIFVSSIFLACISFSEKICLEDSFAV